MLTTIISLIFSKIGALFAGAVGVFGLWFWGRIQKGRADKATAVAQQQAAVIEVYKDDKATDQEVADEKARIESAPVDTWNLDNELQRLAESSGNAPSGTGPDDK
jgi:hypothetical protein